MLFQHPANAFASVTSGELAEDMPESKAEQHAVVTLRTEFLDVQAKHAVAPIAFRETQRDFKRYAAVLGLGGNSGALLDKNARGTVGESLGNRAP